MTTLTKRMAEELTEYFDEMGLKVRYLHSDIDTIERVEIIRDLRKGVFDVLVGINLLREGLDLPEVSLVAILDADREGFLRSTRSLIQTTGRAARNVEGRVLLYADKITDSMARAMEETERRRAVQEEFNREHHITPRASSRPSGPCCPTRSRPTTPPWSWLDEEPEWELEEIPGRIAELRAEMEQMAKDLRFEEAALIRDKIKELEAMELEWRGAGMRRCYLALATLLATLLLALPVAAQAGQGAYAKLDGHRVYYTDQGQGEPSHGGHPRLDLQP